MRCELLLIQGAGNHEKNSCFIVSISLVVLCSLSRETFPNCLQSLCVFVFVEAQNKQYIRVSVVGACPRHKLQSIGADGLQVYLKIPRYLTGVYSNGENETIRGEDFPVPFSVYLFTTQRKTG